MEFQDEIDAIDEAIDALRRRRRFYELAPACKRGQVVLLHPGFRGAPVTRIDVWLQVTLEALGLRNAVFYHDGQLCETDIMNMRPAAPPATSTRPRSPHAAS